MEKKEAIYTSIIEELLPLCPDEIDLTNEQHGQIALKLANRLISIFPSVHILDAIEEELFKMEFQEGLTMLQLAVKMARSKILVNFIKIPISVSIVLAMYKENNRILSKKSHPHGEDFLRKKIEQLEWLFEEKKDCKWELILVDDGCPENSGVIAKHIISKNGLESKARVLFIQDAINAKLDPVKTLGSTGESQKGGSIIYGMWDAVKKSNNKDHIVIFTDADLSTHLGQIGLLMDPLINLNKSVAIGSRRESHSAVIKKGSRNDRGKMFIYLWKQLIPNLEHIIDTQCGFKAFRKEVLEKILGDLIEMKFAFDIELLLKSEMLNPNSIEKVAIAWIDSEAASTTTDLQPYLPMLRSIVRMYRTYFNRNGRSDLFANFIDSLNDDSFNALLNLIPNSIKKAAPDQLGDLTNLLPSDFKE